MEFKCDICDYTSSYKITLLRHVNKKKKCGDNPHIIEIKVNIVCEYCNKTYKTKDILSNHLKICKIKKSSIEEELKLVKEELEKIKKNQSVISMRDINNTTNSNNTTNNFLIQLRPYDNPKLPENMEDIYEDVWERQKSIQTYIERVHFNQELPENHNICITNLRTKLAAKVFNGDRWETKDQDKILDEIITNTSNILDKWVKTNKKRREKYEGDFIKYVEQEGKKKFDEETKNELKLLLYDSYKNGTVNIKATEKKQFERVKLEDELEDE
jgi:hypothetical protein